MKKTRVISLLLALLLIITITPGYGQTILHDKEARSLYELKLFQGVSTSEFIPDLGSMSNREQAMTIIARALQWELDINERSPFGDVSDWAQPYVAKAFKMGITNGISPSEFGAKRNVTQRELATWMLRALGHDGIEAWERTAELSGYIGTRLDASRMNVPINRDVLVGMLFSFMKEGKEVSGKETLIQQYIEKHPEYESIARRHGMIPFEGEQIEMTSIGLVLDPLGVEESSINRMAWEGIKRFQQEKEFVNTYSFSAAPSDSDLMWPFNEELAKERDVIIAVGFIFTDPIDHFSDLKPDKRFILIDAYIEKPNVTSVLFKEEEGSFLAGVAAGMKAVESGAEKVGFIGGIDFELIQKFEAGYEAGVKAVSPSIEVVIDYIGSFTDESLAKESAARMYDVGANVIYHAAGPAGMGVIEEAKYRTESGKAVWVIGVDVDQYEDGLYDGGESVVLTSMVKKFDNVVFNSCEHVIVEGLNGATLFFGIDNDSLGLPDVNPNLSQDTIQKIDGFKDRIISGDIEVPLEPTRLR
ncbi:BMP family lipoprotein [Gudongella sp. SC589]|uniref:BMP family lipoprotein n=1 Tax=Gudongella sp. SC589 TaxID=3385990 RepID=UPI003904695B